MQNIDTAFIVIVVLLALALVVFLAIRNRGDRKKLFPPEATEDTMEKEKKDQQRERDSL